MKRIITLSVLAMALLLCGCSKEKTCRCSVVGTSVVRIIKIDAGDCRDFHTYTYHSSLDSLEVETLVCTDYEFDIDSIYNK